MTVGELKKIFKENKIKNDTKIVFVSEEYAGDMAPGDTVKCEYELLFGKIRRNKLILCSEVN